MMVFIHLVLVWIGQFCRDVIGRQNVKVVVIELQEKANVISNMLHSIAITVREYCFMVREKSGNFFFPRIRLHRTSPVASMFSFSCTHSSDRTNKNKHCPPPPTLEAK